MKYILFLILIITSEAFSQSISVFNASSVADLVEKHVSKIKSFRGSFVYKKDNKTFSGNMLYVSPNKLAIDIGSVDSADSKKIISDGHFVIVQQGDLLARQKLGEENHPVKTWNIRRLRHQYIPTAPSSGLEIMYGSTPAYQIIFEPKWNTTTFRRIEMIADRNGLIRRMRGISRVGVVSEISLAYKEFNRDYFNREFEIVTTEKSQIYDNIFE